MITLVIPTCNRASFLARLIQYYCNWNFNHHIIIADSSDAGTRDENRRNLSLFGGKIAVTHVEFQAGVVFAWKLHEVLGRLCTPYVAIGADDDFHIPAALDCCADFLQAHPECSVVHGDAAIFSLKSGMATGEIAWVNRYPQRSIEHPTGSQRLLAHLGQYSTTWYSVHRTEQLRENLKKVATLGLDNTFGELLPSCLSLIQGKAKKLDRLYMVRQGRLVISSERNGHQHDVFEWISNSNWQGQYECFRDCLADELVQWDGISREEPRELVRRAFWSYLAQCLMKEWEGTYASARLRPPSVWRNLARRIPGAQRAWRQLRSLLPTGRDEMSLAALLRPSSPYHAEFMRVYQAINAGSPECALETS